MLLTKLSCSRPRGFTLVELMVGLVVAMVILLGASKMYINTSEASKNALRATRLNQDMRAAMDLMVSDIRRSGYWGQSAAGSCNIFSNRLATQATGSEYCAASVTTITDIFVSESASCILYSYDYDKDGTIDVNDAATSPDSDEFFGFRLNTSSNTLQIVNPNPGTAFSNTSASCSTGVPWVDLTDANAIRVTNLSFSTEGSQCINVSTNASWSVNADEAIPACLADSTTATGYAVPGTNDNLLEVRQITITLSAQHAQGPFLSRTLTETVQVRAHRAIVNNN